MNHKTLNVRPEEEGVTHLNISPRSVFPACRALYPTATGKLIDSYMGFSYESLIAPIRYMRFKDKDMFKTLMSLDRRDAQALYREISSSHHEQKLIANFQSAIRFIVWERAVLDAGYRNDLFDLGYYKLYSYDVITNTDNGANLSSAKPTNYNTWLPKIYTTVIQALKEGRAPQFASSKQGPWYRDIPSLRDDPKALKHFADGIALLTERSKEFKEY